MRRNSKAVLSGALLVTLILGGLEGSAIEPTTREVVTPVGARAPLFRIRGKVTGLYPGARTSLRATITDPYDFPIVVKRLKATVSSPVHGCPKNAVKVRPWRGARVVPAHRSRIVRLQASMRRSAPDACQGVRFRLRFTGQATKR